MGGWLSSLMLVFPVMIRRGSGAAEAGAGTLLRPAGWRFEVIASLGSGMNYHKKRLKKK
jgi:hypothetical protein